MSASPLAIVLVLPLVLFLVSLIGTVAAWFLRSLSIKRRAALSASYAALSGLAYLLAHHVSSVSTCGGNCTLA